MIHYGAVSRRRAVVVGALALSLLLLSGVWLLPWDYASTWQTAKGSVSGLRQPKGHAAAPNSRKHVDDYFEQVFSPALPAPYAYAALKEACDNAPRPEDDVYLKCGGMAAGLTSIVSQIKVCLKMAVDTGSSLVLPAMPLRDSTNLLDYNFLNGDAYITYDQWFDAHHLRKQMGLACPNIKIVHPDELDKTVPVKHHWEMSCAKAWGYEKFHSYFWAGRPFRHFFDDQYRQLKAKAAEEQPTKGEQPRTGITVVDIDSEFLLFKITDDPTRRDLRLWNDLSHLVRFREQQRQIVHRLLGKMTRPHYGVHFRVENDTIWSSLDNQLTVDLDALDRAWSMYGRSELQRPLVYLACGDQAQVEKFVAAGAGRGWEVTHKWRLAKDDPETTRMINELAFDFQGAVDMGVMVRSDFFMGITGSAFSSTIANQRDVTGRYRGSSFEVVDDEGARNHLFNDLDATEYACCL